MTTLLNVGDVLAEKYRVEEVLGIGGMGMVVAAMHLELEQRVAIKFMLGDGMRSGQGVDRFLREAKAAVKLRSEHTCRVLDVGRHETGAPYIVMEFMEGQDFGHLIREGGALPVADVVDYILQAIEGVAEAHANKIVHRDLKPENLFVTTGNDGHPLVKVLDFGISKSAVGGSATKTGEIMGSPSYMAPEQMMSAKDVDGRADVWALGVILFQALTSQLPFEGDTLPALCMAVMNEPPRELTELCPELPAELGEVISRCLAKPVDERFPDVGALAAALVPFGQPDAATRAARVTKVLGRANGIVTSPTLGTASSPVAMSRGSREPATPLSMSTSNSSPIQTPPPDDRLSTLQASSGQLEIPPIPSRSRRRLVLGLGALVVIGLVVVIASMVTTGGSATTATEPRSATEPAAPLPLPPVVPPAVTTPPVIASPPPLEAVTPPVDAGIPVVDTKPPPRAPVKTTSPPIKPKPAVTKSNASCDPPYVLGADGKRTYKQWCL